MTPRIPQDVEQSLSTSTDGAIRVEGAEGTMYWLLTPQAMEIRDAVLQGLDDAKQGKLKPWDSERIMRLGRQHLNDSPQS